MPFPVSQLYHSFAMGSWLRVQQSSLLVEKVWMQEINRILDDKIIGVLEGNTYSYSNPAYSFFYIILKEYP